MALGATPGDMVRLVLSQLMRPIGVGVLVGGTLAAVAAMVLLSTPMAAGIGSLVRAFDPLAYAVSLASSSPRASSPRSSRRAAPRASIQSRRCAPSDRSGATGDQEKSINKRQGGHENFFSKPINS
jgi:hypothetical protein